jgi:hypothetical protein
MEEVGKLRIQRRKLSSVLETHVNVYERRNSTVISLLKALSILTDAKKNKLAKVRRKLNPTPVKKTAKKSQEEQTKKTKTQPFQCKIYPDPLPVLKMD